MSFKEGFKVVNFHHLSNGGWDIFFEQGTQDFVGFGFILFKIEGFDLILISNVLAFIELLSKFGDEGVSIHG